MHFFPLALPALFADRGDWLPVASAIPGKPFSRWWQISQWGTGTVHSVQHNLTVPSWARALCGTRASFPPQQSFGVSPAVPWVGSKPWGSFSYPSTSFLFLIVKIQVCLPCMLSSLISGQNGFPGWSTWGRSVSVSEQGFAVLLRKGLISWLDWVPCASLLLRLLQVWAWCKYLFKPIVPQGAMKKNPLVTNTVCEASTSSYSHEKRFLK